MADTLPTPITKLVMVPGGIPDLDQAFHEAAGRPDGLPIRIRLPLTLYDPAARNYQSIEAVRWVLELASADDAVRFRADLDLYIRQWVEAQQPMGAGEAGGEEVPEP